MAFMMNLAPPRVSVPERDWSGISDLANRFQQNRADQRTSAAVQEFSKGLDPETARQVAPLLRDPQTRDAGLKMVMERMKGADLPSAVEEYKFAQSQGYQGSFADWEQSKRKAGASSTTINMGEGSKFYEELDKGNAKGFTDLYNEGLSAGRTAQDIDRLEQLLANTPQGAEGAFKAKAGEWGINTEGLDDIQAATALINRLVPGQRPAGSGPMSDRDIELFKSSLPRIINQPGGNQKILETLRGVNAYVRAQGDIAARVANREITPQEGRAQLQALQNPLEGFAATPAPPAEPQNSAPARPASKADYDALPSGTRFIAPDGTRRIKP